MGARGENWIKFAEKRVFHWSGNSVENNFFSSHSFNSGKIELIIGKIFSFIDKVEFCFRSPVGEPKLYSRVKWVMMAVCAYSRRFCRRELTQGCRRTLNMNVHYGDMRDETFNWILPTVTESSSCEGSPPFSLSKHTESEVHSTLVDLLCIVMVC